MAQRKLYLIFNIKINDLIMPTSIALVCSEYFSVKVEVNFETTLKSGSGVRTLRRYSQLTDQSVRHRKTNLENFSRRALLLIYFAHRWRQGLEERQKVFRSFQKFSEVFKSFQGRKSSKDLNQIESK